MSIFNVMVVSAGSNSYRIVQMYVALETALLLDEASI